VAAEEIFDVVNDVDEVIGTATRAEVHAKGLRHRAVHILVFNRSGEIYLQKRSLDKGCSPGLWDTSAAGHVESEESYALAAGRELHEELGLPEDTVLEELFKLSASSATGFEFVHVFRCVATTIVVPDPVEIMEGRWIEPHSLARWIARDRSEFTTTFQEICVKLNYLAACRT